eukprot:11664543-Alexandrium_andersonii.AAC.1
MSRAASELILFEGLAGLLGVAARGDRRCGIGLLKTAAALLLGEILAGKLADFQDPRDLDVALLPGGVRQALGRLLKPLQETTRLRHRRH